MICTKNELKEYIAQDKKALGIDTRKKIFIGNKYLICRFQILYRKYEYRYNKWKKHKSIFNLLLMIYYRIIFNKQSLKLNFSIPINIFNSGLSIAHYGTIVVNGNAKIGKNCRIQENVTIGATNNSNKAPNIGDNVFIGSGAKIIGDICIADDVAIGAGSVVVKNINEKGITVAGIPAKKISNNNSHSNLNKLLFMEEN